MLNHHAIKDSRVPELSLNKLTVSCRQKARKANGLWNLPWGCVCVLIKLSLDYSDLGSVKQFWGRCCLALRVSGGDANQHLLMGDFSRAFIALQFY